MNKNIVAIMVLITGLALAAYQFVREGKPLEVAPLIESVIPKSSQVSTNNLLAISWQNAFCQMNQTRRECRNVGIDAFSASHFTLHGLWPQPRSKVNCKGESKPWLEKELYAKLIHVMPAAASGLHTHEWKKHGTCYGKNAEDYFEDSIGLVEQINNSALQEFFAKNAGNVVQKKEVMQAFDKSFGKGAGRKLTMECEKGLIVELRIALEGEITPQTALSELLKSDKIAEGGCQKGMIDEVGFQRY